MRSNVAAWSCVEVAPADVVTGLGACDRSALATCLALFEDDTLHAHLVHRSVQRIVRDARDRRADGLVDAADRLRANAARRVASTADVDELRLRLWIHLREAFALPARLALSERAAIGAADDLSAAAIHCSEPPQVQLERRLAPFGLAADTERASSRLALSSVVLPCFDALIDHAYGHILGVSMTEAERRLHAERLCTRLATLDADVRADLSAATGGAHRDVDALLAVLTRNASLASFVGAGGAAHCVPLVLAAQADALLPFAAGAVLADAVRVMEDPGALLSAGVWSGVSAQDRVAHPLRVAIALRVLSLRALSGMTVGRAGVRGALAAFARAPELRPSAGLAVSVLRRYQDDWNLIAPAIGRRGPPAQADVVALMDRPAFGAADAFGRLQQALVPDAAAGRDVRSMAMRSIGDLLCTAARVDVGVVHAFAQAPGACAGSLDSVTVTRQRVWALDPLLRAMPGASVSAPAGAQEPVIADQPACATAETSESMPAGMPVWDEPRVAAYLVAARLLDRGHHVVPAGSSVDGMWQLSVDGRSVCVLCVPDVETLTARLVRQPDLPVLVNAELAGTLPQSLFGRVCFVEGFSRGIVLRIVDAVRCADQADRPDQTDQTDQTDQPDAHPGASPASQTPRGLGAPGDAASEAPLSLFAIAWAAACAPGEMHEARLSGLQAIELALLDGGVRGGFAALGGFVGAGIGQLVFGPAGGALLGALLPRLLQAVDEEAGGALDGLHDSPRYRAWAADAQRALGDLVTRLHEALDARFDCMKRAYDAMPAGSLHDYLCACIEAENRGLREFRRRLEQGSASERMLEHRIVEVLRLMATGMVHPVFHAAELARLTVLLDERPSLLTRLSDSADDALHAVLRDALGQFARAGTRFRP